VLTPPAHPAPRPDRQRAQDRQDNARHDREIHPDVLTLILDIPRQAPEPGAAQGPQKQARDHDERADANQDLSELAHEPPSSLFPISSRSDRPASRRGLNILVSPRPPICHALTGNPPRTPPGTR